MYGSIKLPVAPVTGAHETFHSGLPLTWHNSNWIADRSIEYIREHRDTPFCLWASFPDPHHPFDAPEPWSWLHRPEDVELPRHMEQDLDRRPWWHRASLEGKPKMDDPKLRAFRERSSRTPRQTPEQLRHLIANYYGMISLIDHNVGRLRIALHDQGLLDNTIIVYASDHGDWLGDHGLILKGPMAYEGLLRVPLLFEGPGIPAGKTVDDPVSTLDVAQTICDYAGLKLPDGAHSRSLRGLIEGGDTRPFALSEWDLRASRCGVDLDLRTVRTRDAKLTLELNSGAGELYDLRNDPDEMENLFGVPAHQALQKQLTEMIESRPDDAVPRLPQVGMA